jgi:hypothetical protein
MGLGACFPLRPVLIRAMRVLLLLLCCTDGTARVHQKSKSANLCVTILQQERPEHDGRLREQIVLFLQVSRDRYLTTLKRIASALPRGAQLIHSSKRLRSAAAHTMLTAICRPLVLRMRQCRTLRPLVKQQALLTVLPQA